MGTSIKFRHRMLSEKIVSLFPDPKGIQIVDCGCGSGQLCSLLTKVGYEVTGFDISKEKVEYCRSQGLQVYESNIRDLPVEREKIDVVVCSEVLEHLDRNQGVKVLGELSRIVKKGCFILVTVPAEKDAFQDKRHKRYVSSEELIKFLNACLVVENCIVLQREETGKMGVDIQFIVFKKL